MSIFGSDHEIEAVDRMLNGEEDYGDIPNGYKNSKTPERLVSKVLQRLRPLGPYVYYYAVTGSVYIKFRDDNLRSLRIGDHGGKKKYQYKWNLRKDLHVDQDTKQKDGIVRYYYHWDNWEGLCDHILAYARTIDANGRKSWREARKAR